MYASSVLALCELIYGQGLSQFEQSQLQPVSKWYVISTFLSICITNARSNTRMCLSSDFWDAV